MNDTTISDTTIADTSVSDTTVSFIAEEILKEFELYPNPVSDRLFVKSSLYNVEKVEIYSVLGQQIKSIDKNTDQINVSELSNGVYLIKLYAEDRFAVKRFVKN